MAADDGDLLTSVAASCSACAQSVLLVIRLLNMCLPLGVTVRSNQPATADCHHAIKLLLVYSRGAENRKMSRKQSIRVYFSV